MQNRSIPPISNPGAHGRVAPPPMSWGTLLGGAVICAAVLAIAYGITATVTADDWQIAAQRQAKNFVYASPVLDRTIGDVSSVREVSTTQTASDPAVYAIDLQVKGAERKGKVEVDLTREAPRQWVVSGAELHLPKRSVNLY